MLFQKIKKFIHKHESRISAGALLFGFIVDNLTLNRIDLVYENFVTISYLLIVGFGISLNHYSEQRKAQHTNWNKLNVFSPILIQFAVGGLFSAFFVFYSKSANFFTSWPFILLLVVLLIGNEFFKKYYSKVLFQTSIYFVTVFSYFIFFVPILIGKIGDWVFLISGFVSLLYIYLFIKILKKINSVSVDKNKKLLRRYILSLFLLINLLYFTNIIPPAPLSMKDSGFYSYIERSEGEYSFGKHYDNGFFSDYFRPNIELKKGQELYFYSSIFAPTRLNTDIYHHWQYFNEDIKRWETTGLVGFKIAGGRGDGYRGYTIKSNLKEGLWRVDIENKTGQVIGRRRFIIKDF